MEKPHEAEKLAKERDLQNRKMPLLHARANPPQNSHAPPIGLRVSIRTDLLAHFQQAALAHVMAFQQVQALSALADPPLAHLLPALPHPPLACLLPVLPHPPLAYSLNAQRVQQVPGLADPQ